MSSVNVELAEELEKLITKYNDDVAEVTKKAAEEVANVTVDKLQARSPKDRPEYYSGWKTKYTGTSKTAPAYTVYNATHPGLTHVLEKGHVDANQFGSTGKRTKAQKHIAPAEREGVNDFYREIVEGLNEIK